MNLSSPDFLYLFGAIVIFAPLGALIGGLIGWLVTRLTKLKQAVGGDALLGALGMLTELLVDPAVVAPYNVPGGSVPGTTWDFGRYSFQIAAAFAVGLPLIYEILRFRRKVRRTRR